MKTEPKIKIEIVDALNALTDSVRKRKAPGKSPATTCRIVYEAKSRCRNPKHAAYKNYGGRGIEFRFKSAKELFAEIGNKPSSAHTLDRIDNNGHYEKGNVRWATWKEQNNNRRNNRLVTIDGQTKNMSQWSATSGIGISTIYQRLSYGWCQKCSVFLPKQSRCGHKKERKNRA